MLYLKEFNRTTFLMMIGFGEKNMTQADVDKLFPEEYTELTSISYRTD